MWQLKLFSRRREFNKVDVEVKTEPVLEKEVGLYWWNRGCADIELKRISQNVLNVTQKTGNDTEIRE